MFLWICVGHWVMITKFLVVVASIIWIYVLGMIIAEIFVVMWYKFLSVTTGRCAQDVIDAHQALVGNKSTSGWYGLGGISQKTVVHNVVYGGDVGKQLVVTFVGGVPMPDAFHGGRIAANNVVVGPPTPFPFCQRNGFREEWLDRCTVVNGERILSCEDTWMRSTRVTTVSVFVQYETPQNAIVVLED